MLQFLSFCFVILWSSAFITGKVIVDNGSPFASLSFRFAIVAFGFLFFAYFSDEKIIVRPKNILESFISGILFHGLYLGGCFYSFSIGVPASISALIVSMQPILTNILAGPILKEKVTWKQWLGIILGFLGTILVLGFEVGASIPIYGLISTLVALIAATIGTLWQKKLSLNLPLSVSNFYQAVGASIFLFIVMILFENPFINFNSTFILSMSWQILAVSFGAFTILMYLIKIGSASKTSNLFFLIPPVSALMAWLFLDEQIYINDIFGLIICSVGVYIATKKT
jgi:drug/metabolite transporter (DMT)-like permease